MARNIHVLVVDDEYIVRNWLGLLIEKNHDMGFTLAGSASSGPRAIALCRENPVDVVITDIKMAPMDGIEMIRTLKASYPQLRFVIISNYEDFSAAQEGMRLGASDYFLKAEVEDKDILSCLQRLRGQILEQENSQPAPAYRQATEIELLRQQYLIDLFRENPLNETRQELLHQAGITLESQRLVLLVFSLDHFFKEVRFTSPEFKKLHQAVNRFLSSLCPQGLGFINVDGNILGLINWQRDLAPLASSLQSFLTNLHQQLGVSLSVAATDTFSGFNQCAAIYQKALDLLQQRFYTRGQAVCTSLRQPAAYALPDEVCPGHMQAIVGRINCFEYRSAYQQARTMLEKLLAAASVSPGQMRQLCISLVQLFDAPPDPSGKNSASLDALKDIPLCRDLLEAALSEMEECLRRRTARHMDVGPVEQAVDYIHSNFSGNISLSQVAALVHLSESYLSKQFKEKTGESFNTYLSRCRINHAKYLLRNSNARVGAIGAMVGYPNVSYFTQVFKKLTGLSPDQYRADYHAQEKSRS